MSDNPLLPVHDRSRIEILQTAELLFARHGIDGVSLRQIGFETGRRSSGAVQYLFGSKDALIGAIRNHRLPLIEGRRRELLERCRREGRERDLRSLVEVLARPLLDRAPDARHYVAFLARLLSQPGESRIACTAAGADTTAARETSKALVACLGHLPRELGVHRFKLAVVLMITAIAGYEDDATANPEAALPREIFERDLLDSMVGFLRAPQSVADTQT